MTISDPLDLEKTLTGAHVCHLRGSRAILAHRQLLQDFAATTGQHTAMHGLQFKLEHDFARHKTPHLICIVSGHDVSAPLSLPALLGCVLLFEHRLASCNTGLFATGDNTGLGTVIAPSELRAQVAALASCAALRTGRMVLTCFRNPSPNLTRMVFPSGQQGLRAVQVREVQDQLRLYPTYDLTLDTLGKRTRTHLRYYRKRLQSETGCVFVPDAASHIPPSQLASLNNSSLEPVRQRAFDLQFHAAAELPGGYVCGLRASNGRWLCLAGGWRQGRTSLIQWQMNSAGFRKFSLSTAFRAFLIAHEISLGTTQLCFQGGTSHSISHAFRQEYAVDLMLRRPGPLLSLLVRLIPYLAEQDPALANRGNFLVDALRNRHLHWTPLSYPAAASRTHSYP